MTESIAEENPIQEKTANEIRGACLSVSNWLFEIKERPVFEEVR